ARDHPSCSKGDIISGAAHIIARRRSIKIYGVIIDIGDRIPHDRPPRGQEAHRGKSARIDRSLSGGGIGVRRLCSAFSARRQNSIPARQDKEQKKAVFHAAWILLFPKYLKKRIKTSPGPPSRSPRAPRTLPGFCIFTAPHEKVLFTTRLVYRCLQPQSPFRDLSFAGPPGS